jgi:hypothetical protein
MRGLKNKMAVGVQIVIITTLVLLGFTVRLWADDISSQLNIFSPGTTISSNQVNSNFDFLARALPRLKGVVGTSVTASSEPQNLATITVTPQLDGILLLLANAGVTLEQGYNVGGQSWGYSSCNICVTETSNGTDGCDRVVLDTVYLQGAWEAWAPRIHVPFTVFRTVPVTENTPVTYYLTVYFEPGSVGTCVIQGSSLTAIFLPGGFMQ